MKQIYQISVEVNMEKHEKMEEALEKALDRFFLDKLQQKIKKKEILQEAIGYGYSIDTLDNQVSQPGNNFNIRITKEKVQQPLTVMCNQCDWRRLVPSKDRAVYLSNRHYQETGHNSFDTKEEKNLPLKEVTEV